jgi:hypothetical protein
MPSHALNLRGLSLHRHVPCPQWDASEQALPQDPQLRLSAKMSTQLPLQSTSGGEQTHRPALQRCPG